jgi:hypothetical protein
MRRQDRRKQKRRRKELKRAAQSGRAIASRNRANRYPKIGLERDGGDPEFVSTVANIVRDFDFENPAICSLAKRRIY